MIVTVVGVGLSIFSTGEASSFGAAAGVDSGVAAGVGSGVGEVTGGASGEAVAVGSGVALGDSVGRAGEGCGTTVGASDEGAGEDVPDCSGVGDGASVAGAVDVAIGVSVDGAGEPEEEGLSAACKVCAPEFCGVAAGVFSRAEVGCAVSPGLSGAGALTDVAKPGPICSSSPSSEPLTFR